jgi:cyclopropane-fatty-acyl-phospholipid synthase
VRESAAAVVFPMIASVVGVSPVQITLRDHSAVGPDNGPGTLQVRFPNALQRIVGAPGELGLGRAFVAGELDFEGELLTAWRARP